MPYRMTDPIAPAASLPEAAPRRVKILLVDDNAGNLLALEAVLEGMGEELVKASSGKEALRRLLEDDFAAILLDVKMPDMDGFETAALIRSRDRSRHTPILFLTGYKSEEQLYKAYSLGAVDFLFKPIVPEILRSKVQVFVELSRTTDLLRRQAEALQAKNAELERSVLEQRRAEGRFRALLDAAPDPMVISDDRGTIQIVNCQAEAAFGYRRDELLGRDIRLLVPGWMPGIGDGRQPTLATQQTVIHADGRRLPADLRLSPLQTGDGPLVISTIRCMEAAAPQAAAPAMATES